MTYLEDITDGLAQELCRMDTTKAEKLENLKLLLTRFADEIHRRAIEP